MLSALRRLAGSCRPLPEPRSRSLPRCRAPGISPLPRRPRRAAGPRATPGQGQDDRGGTGGAGCCLRGTRPPPPPPPPPGAGEAAVLCQGFTESRAVSRVCPPVVVPRPSFQSSVPTREQRRETLPEWQHPDAGSSGRRGRAQRHAGKPSEEKRGRRGLLVHRRSNKTRRKGDVKRTKVLCPV